MQDFAYGHLLDHAHTELRSEQLQAEVAIMQTAVTNFVVYGETIVLAEALQWEKKMGNRENLLLVL